LLHVRLPSSLSWVIAATLLGCSSAPNLNDNDGGPGSDSSTGADGMTNDQTSPPVDGSFDGPVPPPATSGITITVEPDGSGDAAAVLSAIEGAQTAVHVEMYLLTNSKYIDALIALSKAGKDVKVLLNQTFPTGTSASDTNAATYTQLEGGGVNVKWAPTNTGFDSYTHEKAVIIDPGQPNQQVWVMTMNLDTDAPKYNREFLADDVNAPDIAEAEAIFEADYADTAITPSGNLVVAPSPQNNAVATLVALINSATTSINMESEELDDSGYNTEELVFNALVAKAKAGIKVQVVLEDSTDTSQSSAVTSLVAAGAHVVGYACSASLDIHAKALVVDDARAYVGSENFSGGSLGYNRELGVTFTQASEVTKVNSTIVTDFAGGTTYSATCAE